MQGPWTPLPLQKFSNTPEVGLPQRQPERLHQPRAANNGATLSALSLSATTTAPLQRRQLDGATCSATSL